MVRGGLYKLTIALVVGALCGVFCCGLVASATDPSSASARTIKDPDLFIYIPNNAEHFQPVQILVAMHGMGGDGVNFCQNLLAAADRNGWIVVAPTFKYQDYMNPDLVLQDDLAFLPRLKEMIDSVPARSGLTTRNKVLLYGYSRGGQAAHRFATYYPERTLAVVSLSAGSYTLPLDTMLVNGKSQKLALPYGVADLQQRLGKGFNYDTFKGIPFRIEVGGNDTNANEVPRSWDAFEGKTRVDRARAYTVALQNIGVDASLAVYPGVDHGGTPQMVTDGMAFLESMVGRNATRYGFAPTIGAVSYGALINAATRAVAP